MLAKIIPFQSQATTQKETQSLTEILSFLNRVSSIPDEMNDFKTGTTRIFEEVCQFTKWPIGHLYIRSEQDQKNYVSNDIWFLEKRLDPVAIQDFRQMSEQTVFISGKGLIGIIAQEKEAKSIEDVTVLKQFLRADAAKRSGVRRFFGFPILVGGQCVGVAEFYGRQAGIIDETSLEIMKYVSAQLARLYERDQAEKQKSVLKEKFKINVQNAIEDLSLNTSGLKQLGADIQQQVSQNKRQCDFVESRKNQISINISNLKDAMLTLKSTADVTATSNQEVNGVIKSLSGQITMTLAELAKLGELTANIETVANQVSEISNQVKMLGLNAAIEAARAGESGKGFAIVATEIKSLANQSEQSSKQISEQLSNIQQISDQSISFMEGVNNSMGDLNQKSTDLNSILAEQNNATCQIEENLSQVSSKFDEISGDIEMMSQNSLSLDSASQTVSEQSKSVDTLCRKISVSSENFIGSV